MSPRAACRLETLGFERVYDYVLGKADWLAHGLPSEGEKASVASAGDLCDPDPPTCALDDALAAVRARLADSRYGFCLVIDEQRVLLGRVRRSVLDEGDAGSTVEGAMESGPSTVRPSQTASELVSRLATRELHTAILTTPEGVLFGVLHRADAERWLAEPTR